jgi:hypothetical protein
MLSSYQTGSGVKCLPGVDTRRNPYTYDPNIGMNCGQWQQGPYQVHVT